jgi:predicted nucleotidyltransferase
MTSLQDIQNYANKIAERFHPEKIILFGSYAYGKPTEDSDVDLMVIMNYTGKSYEKATEISIEVEPSFAMDLLVRRKADYLTHVQEKDPFFREVARGKTLYEQ